MKRTLRHEDKIKGVRIKRRIGECVNINHGDIVMQVVEIANGHVILAFCSEPGKNSILREEVEERLKKSDLS